LSLIVNLIGELDGSVTGCFQGTIDQFSDSAGLKLFGPGYLNFNVEYVPIETKYPTKAGWVSLTSSPPERARLSSGAGAKTSTRT